MKWKDADIASGHISQANVLTPLRGNLATNGWTMTADAYREAIDSLGLSQVKAAHLFAVNERTSRRWALGEQDIPKAVEIALKLMLVLGRKRLEKIGIL